MDRPHELQEAVKLVGFTLSPGARKECQGRPEALLTLILMNPPLRRTRIPPVILFSPSSGDIVRRSARLKRD
jgi:hypothetical protein